MAAGDARQPDPPSRPPPSVSARDVLRALSDVRRKGAWALLQDLETAEPDLAEFVMEEISAMHHTLLDSGARPRIVRRLQRQVQSLVLVCVGVLTPRRDAGERGSDTGWAHDSAPRPDPPERN